VNAPTVLYSRYSSSSPYSGIGRGIIPVTQENGKISDSYTDFTVNKTFSGATSFTGSVSTTGRFNSSSTNPSTINFVADGFVAASSTVTSTIYGTLNVDRIGPATTNTTTLSKNIQVGGDINYGGKNYGANMMQGGQFSKAINDTTDITVTHNLGATTTMISLSCMHSFATALAISEGTYTASGQSSTYSSIDGGNGTGSAMGQDGSNIAHLEDSGAARFVAAISSVSATSFTLSVSTNPNSGNTRRCQYKVFR
jgi:hypothetical protein